MRGRNFENISGEFFYGLNIIFVIVDWGKINKNIKIALSNEPVSTKNIDILQNELVLSEIKLHSDFSLDKPSNLYLTRFIIEEKHPRTIGF